MNNLGGQIPDTELFGDRKMHLLQNWMGPGSPRPDSFQQSWKYSKVWMVYGNPPYSRISAVLQKFRSDKAYGIFILPRWTNKSWHRMAMGMALKKFVIRGHESIFEDEDGRPFPGPGWDVWGLLLDGSIEEDQEIEIDAEPPQWSKAKRRRDMRKNQRKKAMESSPPPYEELMRQPRD